MKIRKFFLGMIAGLFGSQSLMAQSQLFEVAHPDGKTKSYLFGTFHSGVKPPQENIEMLRQYILKCNLFISETDLDSLNKTDIQPMMMASPNENWRSLLSEKDYSYLRKFVDDTMHLNMAMIDQKLPMYLSILLTHQTLVDMGAELGYSMDQDLHKMAKQMNKKTKGLETEVEAMQAMTRGIPPLVQAQYVLDQVKSYQTGKMELKTMKQYYEEGKLDTLYSLSMKEMPMEVTSSLLFFRNDRWMLRLVPMLLKDNAFIAVGALHLPGNNGLIQQLTKKGFIVTPVTF